MYSFFSFYFKGSEIMFNNPYTQTYNTQPQFNNLDQNYLNMLDKEEEKIKNMRNNYMNRYQQPTNLTQNFQLAPTRDVIRYANNIDEVGKDVVTGDTPFFSRDMSIVWIKNANGEIKTYELNEVVLKDEKDMKIDLLMAQIEDLKRGMMKYESNTNVVESSESKESTDVPTISKSTKTKK
jgi:hypothetical protein